MHYSLFLFLFLQRDAMRLSQRDATCFFAGVLLTTAVRILFGALIFKPTLDVQLSQVSVRTAISQEGEPNAQPRSPSQIIREIIPESLQSVYSPQNLLFNVTESMLQQSRPIKGNTERLHSFIRKLRNKVCTTVVVSGGSVTAGRYLREPYTLSVFVN